MISPPTAIRQLIAEIDDLRRALAYARHTARLERDHADTPK